VTGNCIHQLDLCPTCHGLRVTSLHRLEGVDNITIIGPAGVVTSGPATVYIGPVPADCPDESPIEERP
jgi:hypothetical protein